MHHSSLRDTTVRTLRQLIDLLAQLDGTDYSTPLPVLSGSSIGQHVRHILEFYQCLFNGLRAGEVNYDARPRDPELERHAGRAIRTLSELIRLTEAVAADQPLSLRTSYAPGETAAVPTTLYRELIYNLEHCIHHQATIRIGVQALTPALPLSEAFGVAPSTLYYRQAHVHRHVSTVG